MARMPTAVPDPALPTDAPAPHRWRRLVAACAVVASSLSLVGGVTSPTPIDAACAISSSLRIGARGAAVRCLQSSLATAGYSPGPIDGIFGSMTHGAVVRFQRARGLIVDGIVGPQTGRALGIWGTAPAPTPAPAPNPPPAASPPASQASCVIASTLRVGARGDAVRCLQSRLAALGHAPGPVDSVFGSMTRAAVIRFQRARGLIVDGVVGPQTGRALGIWSSGTSASGCNPPAGTPAAAGQVVVVTASGSWADVDLLVRTGAGWTCGRMNMVGRVGSNGVRTLAQRRSGDGTTPGGVFALGTMTAWDGQTFQFFGNGPNPGVPGTWRQVRAGDCWGATPGTPSYNLLVQRQPAACTGDDEYLPHITGAYSAAALIGANMGPARSGDAPGEPALAAAIFLHRHSYDGAGASRPTAGCVSLSATDLVAVLRQLVPGQAWFVIR